MSLASPGTALGSSKAKPSLWQWLRTILLLHSHFKSSTLEALLLERCFAQMLYICEEKCLGRTSSFCPSYLPLAQEFRTDGQLQAVVFRSGRSISEQPAFSTDLWHVHNCRTQLSLFEMVSAI